LLGIELSGSPVTKNRDFVRIRKECAQERADDELSKLRGDHTTAPFTADRLFKFAWRAESNTTADHCEQIHDIVKAYYAVARDRLIDSMCQHVIFYFLLGAEDSPIKILSSKLILSLSPAQLETIAGEDSGTVHRRQVLKSEIRNLEEAVKVLKS
jgi:hypothetical protein